MDPLKSVLLGSAAGFLATLGSGQFDVLAMRPYIDASGTSRIAVRNEAGKVSSIQVNAPASLRYDEWKDIDRTVTEVFTQRLVGIADLQSRGLTHPLGSIGVTISQWQKSSDMSGATADMSGITPGEEDTPAFLTDSVPVPIIHMDYRLNLRRLEASRRMGEGLDVTAAALAARNVAEKSESMLFAGDPIIVDGAAIYGYTTHPDRNLVTMTTAWSSITQANNYLILEDVAAMTAAARADRRYGPYVIYIPAGYQGKMDQDYRAAGDSRTLRERLLQSEGISDIKVADFLTGNNVVLVQMDRQTVDLATAQDITTVEWPEQGGMQRRYKVMAVWVPRLKSDFDGRMGVVHLRTI